MNGEKPRRQGEGQEEPQTGEGRSPPRFGMNGEKGTMKGVLIDIDYITKDQRAIIRMFLKGKEKLFKLYDDRFEPYIYIEGDEKLIPKIMAITAKGKMGEPIKFTKAEKTSKWIGGVKKDVLKVYCIHPGHVPILRDYLADFKIYEHNIPFALRYIIDKQLPPLQEIEFEYVKIGKRKRVTKYLGTKDTGFKLKTMAFDIETYNPHGAPRPKIDPIVMLSYATEEKSGVLSFKKVKDKGFVQIMNDEGEVLKRFGEVLNENDVEMLVGYNSAMFDLPYMQERSNALKVPLKLGRDGSSFRVKKAGMRDVARIMGRLHIDLYPIIWFLSYIGAMKVSSLTLKNAYRELMGKGTMEVERLDIWKMWDDENERKMLADYSLADAKATLELAEKVLPAEVELSKISHMPLLDVCNASSGQMVEALLMSRSFLRDEIIPNKPTGDEAKTRSENPIEGAYVKLPIPGLYDNIAVFDFRGLYPSIIISHNIDGGTLNCKDCEDAFVSPQGHRFCKKKQGLIPQVLDELITVRGKLKDAVKKLKPGTDEYQRMFARQWALKILANSFYGYMAYPRSRWYSRASAESVTGWGRYYIQDTIKQAEDAGFEVLYGDTDSIFLLMKGKKKEEVL
ncbi:DNA polymerase [Candidatus Gugararchaeum adminiculabundum]|nr:DNA polymerase [Candidatus Gugararchaeum adminiculabundum]